MDKTLNGKQEHLELLRRKYDFKKWHDTNKLDENLFIWKYLLGKREFLNWRSRRITPIDVKGVPPHIRSIWSQSLGGPEKLLRVDVLKCSSRAHAHDHLLELLGKFESSNLIRQEQLDIGDVSFSFKESSILFARANLVIFIVNASRNVVHVIKIARRFDKKLISKIKVKPVNNMPIFQKFDVILEKKFRDFIPLDVKVVDPQKRSVWFKFFSKSGEVFLQEKLLVYRTKTSGPQKITAFAINYDGTSASKELEFDME